MLLLLFISALFHFSFALPTPTGFVLTHQNPGLAKQLIAHPAVTCPPCPTTSSIPQLQIPAPPAAPLTATSPCPAQNVQTVPNSAHPRVKRGCCCCCCKPCCCCCGCALNICVKPSCCCKCCPTCCCCTGYGCKKRRRRALPVSPLIESMPLLTRSFGEMKWQKRG